MPAVIDVEMGVVSLKCEVCGRETTVELRIPNGLDWRLKDGTQAFCSLKCEMEHGVKNQEKAAA